MLSLSTPVLLELSIIVADMGLWEADGCDFQSLGGSAY
jgi:hypothetical protein